MQSLAIRGAALSGMVGGAAALAYAVRGRSSCWLAPCVYKGVVTRRSVALTFDDGPSESTPRLLDVLYQYGAPATFFQCGMNVERLPAVAKSVRDAGHELGNHTYSHPALHFRARCFIERELSLAQEIIGGATGVRPALFRAPYGIRWFGLGRIQRKLNLAGVTWTIMGRDWKLGSGEIAARVLNAVSNGAIICLHDGRELQPNPDIRPTLEAVGSLIPALLARGFQFETVSQILCPTN